MTDQPVEAPDHAVHIGATEALVNLMQDDARAHGVSVIDLDFSGVSNREGLADRLAETFAFPYPSSGLDGAVDFVSDLEWFEHSGFLVVVDCADTPATVVADLASILPGIIDRWRSGPDTFVVVIRQTQHHGQLRASLDTANSAMDRMGALPWVRPDIGSVTVIEH